MKLKKVASICSQTGIFRLFDQMGADGEIVCQWLGDGGAEYPMMGLPYMDKENICAIFDIPEKKREKLLMCHDAAPETVNWNDTDRRERLIGNPILCVRYEGRELLPLKTSEGVIFIQRKYLAPLDGMEYVQLFERRNAFGGVYVVAKVGMLIQAVIFPVDVVRKDLIDRLEELTALCRAALLKKDLAQDERDEDQSTLFQTDGGAEE